MLKVFKKHISTLHYNFTYVGHIWCLLRENALVTEIMHNVLFFFFKLLIPILYSQCTDTTWSQTSQGRAHGRMLISHQAPVKDKRFIHNVHVQTITEICLPLSKLALLLKGYNHTHQNFAPYGFQWKLTQAESNLFLRTISESIHKIDKC